MTETDTHTPTDNQNEKMIDSLRNEIADLKSHLKRKTTGSPLWTSC